MKSKKRKTWFVIALTITLAICGITLKVNYNTETTIDTPKDTLTISIDTSTADSVIRSQEEAVKILDSLNKIK